MKDVLTHEIQSMTMTELFAAIYTDHLTGVMNRKAFDRRMALPFDVIAIADNDSLKYVNDTAGYREGDEHITELAIVLRLGFGRENVYRLGGDEFVVVADAYSVDTMAACAELFPKFSYGTGPTVKAADINLKRNKAERVLSGQRVQAGMPPPWFKEVDVCQQQ